MPRAELQPRNRMTAYAFFVQTARREQIDLHPNVSVVSADFTRSCAGRWNALSEDEKQPFKAMAERDKVRFGGPMQSFPGEKTAKKEPEDTGVPKKALSPFDWFCNDERPKVKDQNPDYGIMEVAQEVGKLWGEAGPDVRQKYQEMSDSDKSRYQREMDLYKANGGAHPQEDDEEEKESDED